MPPLASARQGAADALYEDARRLFEGLAPEQIELERTRILEGEDGVTHMHYRVRR